MRSLQEYTINTHIRLSYPSGGTLSNWLFNASLKGISTAQNVPTPLLPTAHFSLFRQQPGLKPEIFPLTPLQNELPPPPNSW